MLLFNIMLAFINLRESIDSKTIQLLHEASGTYVSNNYVKCWWNDWRSRDQECNIQGTYINCRFSKQSYIPWLGMKNGRWFCCYTRHTCYHLGQTLD